MTRVGTIGGSVLATIIMTNAVFVMTFATGGMLSVASPPCWSSPLHRYGAWGSVMLTGVFLWFVR